MGFSYKPTSAPIVNITRNSHSIEANINNEVIIPVGLKTQDIKPLFTPQSTTGYTSLSTALGTTLFISDDDGDASLSTNVSALGDMEILLFEDGNLITPLTSNFTPCSDYKLTVKIKTPGNTVTAKTQYGAPDKREYTGNTVATYSLKSNSMRICHIETGDMTVLGTPGFNNAVWDAGKGFNVKNLKTTGKDFPTTGFRNATLKLVGSGINQNNYVCKLAATGDSTYIDLSTTATVSVGKGCELTYKGPKISHSIQIDMYHSSSTTTPIDSYTIPAATLWADGAGTAATILKYNAQGTHLGDVSAFTGNYDAANYCANLLGKTPVTGGFANQNMASSFFFTGAELSNGSASGFFTRDADGTFMGEWGWLYPGSWAAHTGTGYPSSPWSAISFYWTADIGFSSETQSYLLAPGWTGSIPPADAGVAAVCRR